MKTWLMLSALVNGFLAAALLVEVLSRRAWEALAVSAAEGERQAKRELLEARQAKATRSRALDFAALPSCARKIRIAAAGSPLHDSELTGEVVSVSYFTGDVDVRLPSGRLSVFRMAGPGAWQWRYCDAGELLPITGSSEVDR